MAEKKKTGADRNLSVRVKTAKGRKLSSTLWLQRQLNDPYVKKAKQDGYRSRAAYKLLELDERYHFLKPGQRVVDLGAAPGGWTQVCVERTQAIHGKGPQQGKVVGIDLLPVPEIAGATLIRGDFTEDTAPESIKNAIGGAADVVLSDMAPNTTGHTATDHLRIMALCELAYHFACEVLNPDGVFLAKVFQGGTEHQLLADIKRRFRSVRHAKPKASRADSAEMYVIATGFRSVP